MCARLDKIKRFFRNFEIPNLISYIVATMAVIYVGDMASGYMISPMFSFYRSAILRGQIWRLVTFLGIPTAGSPVWLVISLMFYYSIGRSLESGIGSRQMTRYMLVGTALTAAGGLISGTAVNDYLFLSMFLAFAALSPNSEFLMFFFIPVKAKWLAALDAVFMIVTVIFGSFSSRLGVAAALGTFLIFFGNDFLRPILNKIKHRDFISEMRRNNIKVRGKK